MGALIKILVICLLIYWVVRFVVNLALPIYRAVKKIKQQQQHFAQNAGANGYTQAKSKDNSFANYSYKGGEYIEYEEVESRNK